MSARSAAEPGGASAPDVRALVRGRACRDWIAHLDVMRRRRLDDAALELLLDCIGAAEQEVRELGCSPHPTFTLRAAVIYRRRRDRASEVDVLQRWVDASPPSEDVPSPVSVRLARARRLLAAEPATA